MRKSSRKLPISCQATNDPVNSWNGLLGRALHTERVRSTAPGGTDPAAFVLPVLFVQENDIDAPDDWSSPGRVRIDGLPLDRQVAALLRRGRETRSPPRMAAGATRAPPFNSAVTGGGWPSAARTLEHAQQIAGHASPKTTKLYDRPADAISVDEIERIVI